jgi:SAM-dependent methyltransferase
MIMDFARSALSFPVVYDSYQSLVGAPRCHQRFVTETVRPNARDRVLDIGCGVGASVRYLPAGVRYVGIDISEAYIARARADYADRGDFFCVDVGSVKAETLGQFDLAFSFGVLHHLSDGIVARVIELVRKVVRPGGRFVTIDPCYVAGQNAIAKLLIDNDRGEYVRDEDGYTRLMAGLGEVRATVHHDLLRIPYTQVVMQVDLR